MQLLEQVWVVLWKQATRPGPQPPDSSTDGNQQTQDDEEDDNTATHMVYVVYFPTSIHFESVLVQ